ncbi:hypothetical protein C0J45_16354 [Silurus meridionalis]|uniref:Uncharacterized protein n=1 Tax=Silurus asotus TaxID=30991 RepID=A0AAD5FTW6_SILAS|nr:hypothetical protein C0J45_16354 [Silurus meridionalis]KAI5627732.1 hypothetical protein C0J50_8373 [Silurus asotus]
MEENPIYGNITYTQTHNDDKQKVETQSEIQYSDVVMICEELEEKTSEDKDSCSGLSDLYASVDVERVKSKKAQSNEAYANHV